MPALQEKFTLSALRQARQTGQRIPMLTCYDFLTARLMQEAGVPMLLVGDSAASVVLGHETTLPVSLDFMIDITAAVRRGAPLSLLVADMPFGSYQASTAQGVENVCRMVQRTNCDVVKIETGRTHFELVRTLSDAGVAVMAHLGLRPQAVGVLGGYRYQGRTVAEASDIVALSLLMEEAGAAAVLLEAVPPEVADAVSCLTNLPVVGCGAGPGCHACVIVTQDGLGLTGRRPRFVPELGDLATPLREAFGRYVSQVASGHYPAPEHNYAMPPEEKAKFETWIEQQKRK
jgi:3-methyl-2-oxobutanoate hydroxymethyltransferase